MPTNRLLPGLTLLASLVAFAGVGCSAEGEPEDDDNIVVEDEDVGASASALCTNKTLIQGGTLGGLPVNNSLQAVLKVKLEAACNVAYGGTPSNFKFSSSRGMYASSISCRVCK